MGKPNRRRHAALPLPQPAPALRSADDNPEIDLQETVYVHGGAALAVQERFRASNSACEVDLTGQVNAETAYRRSLGAVGGAGDFLRAASRAPENAEKLSPARTVAFDYLLEDEQYRDNPRYRGIAHEREVVDISFNDTI